MSTATLLDNFEPFTEIRLGALARNSTAHRDGEAAWRQGLLQPVMVLLAYLGSKGVLEEAEGVSKVNGQQGMSYSAVDGHQQTLHALWRLFSGDQDFLRRCVDRYERLRPPLEVATRKRRASATSAQGINPLWKLDRPS